MTRAAVFEVQNAFLWTDFGVEFALRHFTQEQIDQLPKFVRGSKKGKVKGMITWVKCIEGGFVYFSPCPGAVPTRYVENRRGRTIAYALGTADYGQASAVIVSKYEQPDYLKKAEPTQVTA
jgi:hypothetical protein